GSRAPTKALSRTSSQRGGQPSGSLRKMRSLAVERRAVGADMCYYLSLIPEEPNYVPSAQAQTQARDAFRAFLKKKALHISDKSEAEIEVEVSENIQFVDQGLNFESVSCPACGTEIEFESWTKWMDRSYESNFRDRSITMRCCGCETDLN